uniref:G-protein coupled receptors family 1 profile domain-containing protein n=1 Tax=Romanomermis culicivorax TaxID=13658 RepID=A0A915IVV9_ROMCU
MTNATGTEYDIRLHFFTYTVLGYLIPLTVTCCLYCVMLHKLWFRMPGAGARRHRHQTTMLKSASSGESLRAKRKVTWMISGVIVCFAICWLPLNGCFVYTALTYRPRIGPPYSKAFFIVMVCSQSFAYTNSCLNPILYAFLSGKPIILMF